jgi:hypothetical protein
VAGDPAVDVIGAHDVIAGAEELQTRVHGGHPAGIHHPVFAAVDGGEVVLEHLAGRVR